MQSSPTIRKNKVPVASFSMSLPRMGVERLLQGTLVLTHPDGTSTKYDATSGCPYYQFDGSYKLRGRGCIPPSAEIDAPCYTIKTSRLWLPNVPGVEGSFYEIDPDIIRTHGIRRGDFGVHWDARFPGSAGCIVLHIQRQWDDFRAKMEKYNSDGVKQIELSVDYQSPNNW